ncbi:phage tail protein [Candidatus Woesearchaeota archaeon]|nr:phage tail protein [Candidatus Woesearchaeota archaeon]
MKRHILVLVLSFLVLALIALPASATVRKTGSQGDYFPLTFSLADGDVPALIDVASINVLFDPPVEAAKATPRKHHDIQGLDAPTLEFTSGEPYRLQMDLFFDRYEEGKSVREYTDAIEKLALVDQEKHRPPTSLLITWGTGLLRAVIESCDPPRFTLFLDDGTPLRAVANATRSHDDGIPVRAVMNCVFTDFLPADNGKNDGAHKRPGPARYSNLLEIDGVVVGSFKEISGLESETEIIEIKDGDDMIVIRLKNGFISDPALTDWVKEIMKECQQADDNIKKEPSERADPKKAKIVDKDTGEKMREAGPPIGHVDHGKGSIRDPGGYITICEPESLPATVERKSGSIIVLDRAGQETMRYNFFDAFPVKWRGPALDTKGDVHTVEELVLAVGNIEQQLQTACVQPPAGIIGWWSGDSTEDLVGNNNAILHDDAGFASGRVGDAFGFDGAGDYVSIPYSPTLEPSEITVEFWVSGPIGQPGNTGSGVMLVENSPIHADHEGWYIFITPSGGIGTTIGDGTAWNPVISTIGLPYPGWLGWGRHVAMTYDGTTLKLYIDGVLQGSNQVSNAQLATGRDINLGASWNSGSFASFFTGLIDEVEIYDRALSMSEIQAIYNAGSSGKCKPNICVSPPSDMVSWWTLDDSAGSPTANDLTGSNDGTVQGVTLGVNGKVDTAGDFDGSNDYIEVPHNADFDVVNELTIDTWVKFDSFPTTNAPHFIVLKGTSLALGNGGYVLFVDQSAKVSFWIRNPAGITMITSASSLAQNTWHHVAVTLDLNNHVARLYIDGQLDKSQSVPYNTVLNAVAPLSIGRNPCCGGDNYLDGTMDELEIFNRALTSYEIWTVYNAGTAGKCKLLVPVPVPDDDVV